MAEEEKSKEEPQAGDLINFTKEIDFGVMDDEGNRIQCKDIATAKTLSLLFEIKAKLEEKPKEE